MPDCPECMTICCAPLCPSNCLHMQGLSRHLAAHSLRPSRRAGSRRGSLTSGHSWGLRRRSGVGQVTPRMRGWQHCRCTVGRHCMQCVAFLEGQPACLLPGVALPWQTRSTCLPHAAHITHFASLHCDQQLPACHNLPVA